MSRIIHIYLLTAVLLGLWHSVQGQDSTRNYVSKVTYLQGRDSILTVQYYDGLGRPDLLVSGGQNTDQLYLYTQTEYDGLGRARQTWLPVVGNQSPDYITLSENEDRAYSRNVYDALDRITYTSTPGRNWAGRGKRSIYRSNDTLEVKYYSLPSLTVSGYYAPGTLSCTESIDEDSIRRQVFTDCLGRTILERRGLPADTLDTYHVYNDLSQLSYVLTPQYQTDPDTARHAYCYSYDAFGRLTVKKLPGCEPITYEYDHADRLIKMQDGQLRVLGKSRTYSYDHLGRLEIQGIEGGETELINYYDHYTFLNQYEDLNPDSDDGRLLGLQWYQNCEGNAVGYLTGTWQRASDGTPLLTTYVYDKYGRVLKRSETGLGRKVQMTEYAYNKTGDIINETTSCYTYDIENEELSQRYLLSQGTRYDYRGTRLPSSRQVSLWDFTRNTDSEEIVSELSYDDHGHLIQEVRASIGDTLSYGYDSIRGWLKEISSKAGGFHQTLRREEGGENAIPRWNGSLSAMIWRTEQDIEHHYNYGYDTCNRLTTATYLHYGQTGEVGSQLDLIPASPSVPDYGVSYQYDKNSNVTHIRRYGAKNDRTYGLIDDIEITYNGNQRDTATDNVANLTYAEASEFVRHGAGTYAYNRNGALCRDENRGIDSIEYDLLGNLKKIQFTGERSIEYVYSASGEKLREIHKRPRTYIRLLNASGGTIIPGLNVHICDTTDYLGPLILRKGHPEMLRFDGGYISFDSDTISGIHYYVKDYMGNNRMVVNRDGTVEQVTHYYPYGGIIGDISTNQSLQKYKFEGKELDRTFGLDNYDIEARQYFAMAPVWDRMDPLAEKYYGISPYAYCGGDPINRGDYNGMFSDSIRAAIAQTIDAYTGSHFTGEIVGPVERNENPANENETWSFNVFSYDENDGPTITREYKMSTETVSAISSIGAGLEAGGALAACTGLGAPFAAMAEKVGVTLEYIGLSGSLIIDTINNDEGSFISDAIIGLGSIALGNQINRLANDIPSHINYVSQKVLQSLNAATSTMSTWVNRCRENNNTQHRNGHKN